MDVTNEVLEAANKYLKRVTRSGSENIMAVCPFHRKADGSEESSPSFSMSLTKGVYYCHSCHERGTFRKFLNEMGVNGGEIQIRYKEVIDSLGKNSIPKDSPIRPAQIFNSEALDDSVLGLFDHDIAALMPGFAPETLQHFDIGWDGWHSRITFPIHDLVGRLVAVSGRAVHKQQVPRYKVYTKEYNTWGIPPRLGWNKRTVLWNMHNVYPVFHRTSAQAAADQYIIVVEGFKAAMWLWQCGYRNVVALLGSYMSWEHEWLLTSLGCPVYLFLDNNEPGKLGQYDAAARLNRAVSVIRMVQYPERLAFDEKAQPDSLSASEVMEQVGKAPTFVNWKLSTEIQKRL